MSEIVDRVVWEIINGIQQHSIGAMTWDDVAIQVIGAMREPTTKMLNAACASMSPAKRPTQEHITAKKKHLIRYQAMIDAALGRGGE